MRTPLVHRAALAGTLAYGLYAAGIRSWIYGWDASAQEREEALPGDTLIPEPAWVGTRAVTVAAPPRAVWPWLVQMGEGRAGWYSCDRPGAPASAWHLIPQFEDLEVGSVLHLHPDAALRVVRLEHERALVLSLGQALTWAFVVKPLPDDGTRLLERVRISVPGDRAGPRILVRLGPLGLFLAQRKQLLGIKARAERAWHGHVEGPVESHVA